MKTVEMPKMGDTMEEGKILRWIKHEGDTVKKGESLAEVETDKVNIEIEAFAGGVLRKILVPEGESAPIGAGIALIGTPDEPLPDGVDGGGTSSTSSAASPASSATSSGAQPPAQPAPIKNTVPMAPTATAAPTGSTAPAPGATEANGRIFISPLARRYAQEQGIDYAAIRGTGPNGRIIKLDVEAALAQAGQPASPIASVSPATSAQPVPPAVPAAPMPLPEPEPALPTVDTGETVEIPLTAMRRTIAMRLSQSMQTAPHFYVTSVVDTGKLAELRAQINAYAATDPAPVKVSFNDLIIKAVAKALLRMPQVNVSFAEDRLIQKKQVHVGMAVAP